MAPKWQKNDRHLLPLALLAMFSLMVPLTSIINSNTQTRRAEASMREQARMQQEQVVEPVWTPDPSPAGTPKSRMMYGQ